jgi:hypothetical protein
LSADFRIVAPPRLGAGEVLLYVNHFGLCDAIERELEAAYPRECLVFDHAQALYAGPGGAATIYSPRKFLGVADGGILATGDAVPAPVRVDPGSEGRLLARMLRTSRGAEAGFQAFREAEQSLDGQPPLTMSALTRRVLAAVDHDRVAEQRRRNFEFVHAALGKHNRLRLALLPGQVPLCYPLWPRRAVPRAALHRARVYVPTYWPELLEDPRTPPAERGWAAEWLHLPIDQRYDTATLHTHVVAPIRALLDSGSA